MYINLCDYLIHDMFIYLLKMYNMFIRFACFCCSKIPIVDIFN